MKRLILTLLVLFPFWFFTYSPFTHYRMFANCKAYNAPETEYYNCANILERFFNNKLKDHGLMDKL